VEDDLNVVVVDGIPTSMHDLTQTPKVRGKREENGGGIKGRREGL
jgi:hypothetical protein